MNLGPYAGIFNLIAVIGAGIAAVIAIWNVGDTLRQENSKAAAELRADIRINADIITRNAEADANFRAAEAKANAELRILIAQNAAAIDQNVATIAQNAAAIAAK